MTLYRKFNVTLNDVQGWQWVHEDYDGPEDRRAGTANTETEARGEVDAYWEDIVLEALQTMASCAATIQTEVLQMAMVGEGKPSGERLLRIRQAIMTIGRLEGELLRIPAK